MKWFIISIKYYGSSELTTTWDVVVTESASNSEDCTGTGTGRFSCAL